MIFTSLPFNRELWDNIFYVIKIKRLSCMLANVLNVYSTAYIIQTYYKSNNFYFLKKMCQMLCIYLLTLGSRLHVAWSRFRPSLHRKRSDRGSNSRLHVALLFSVFWPPKQM